MFGIGGFELFLILLFGFLIFGPDKLPAMAKTLGKAIAKFRNAQEEMSGVLKGEMVFDKDAEGNMGCNDFRNVHDVITEWVFTKDPDIEPFTPGTDKMEREDWKTALTMLYKRFGWDEELGCPTKECLTDLGLDDVATDLEGLGLLTEGGAAYADRTRTYAGILEEYCGDNPALA